MNWVGGLRNRVVMKNDAKKQREFFEKRKLQQRLKHLGIALPASPPATSCGSMDLVNLFIVNQIAAKKEVKDPPKVAVLGSCKGGFKHKRNEPLVLPMSPCSPSQLSLVEGQPQYRESGSHLILSASPSVQGTRKRKHVIPQGFKCRQLSPVLESAFSDNSVSDYLPPITDPLSPFSSTSSASSGQGLFPLQLNLQQRSQTQAQPPSCSPPPWDTSGLEQTKFQPFSQPRGMADSIPWSCGSKPPLYQLKTPRAAQIMFTSPEPDSTKARGQTRHEVPFSLSQPGDKEPMLDFTLNQSETEQQFDGDVFRGFSTEDCGREAFGRGQPKIYLKDETPAESSTPQTVPDSQCMEMEESNHIYDLSNCTDMNFSCLEHNNGPMNGCEYSPSGRGYLSSDSNDDEEGCQPCLQAASSYMDQACCADSLNQNLGFQGNLKQRHTKPRPLTLLLKPQINFRGNQKVMEMAAFPVKALGSSSIQTGSNTAQFASPRVQSSELCTCKRTANETRDAATQTFNTPTPETCDAETQCSVVVEDATTGFNLCRPPVDVSVQHPATGRQTDTAAGPSTHTPSTGKARSREKNMLWTQKKSTNTSTANNSGGVVILQRPKNPFLDALSMTDGRGKENRGGRDERGQQENGRPVKDLSNEVREEVTSATRANRLSEEADTLQEEADISLLLKRRKKAK